MLFNTNYANWWDLWNFHNHLDPLLNHRVVFDGETRTIWILENITELEVKEHLYSDWKEWVRAYDFSKFIHAFETEGGKPISPTEKLGDSYFLVNNWKIRQRSGNIPTTINGNLYGYDNNGDPANPYLPDEQGRISIQSKVSTLVNTVVNTVPAVVSADDIASAVWSAIAANFNVAGTTGSLINNVDMKVSEIQAGSGPTVEQIRDGILNAPAANHDTAGTIGERINNVDVDVSTRLAADDYTPGGPAGLTPSQETTLNLAYEEARRARAMATNNVQITRTGTGAGMIDEIVVYDDDGTTVLYRIRVFGDKAESRTIVDFKPY